MNNDISMSHYFKPSINSFYFFLFLFISLIVLLFFSLSLTKFLKCPSIFSVLIFMYLKLILLKRTID